MIGSGLVGGGVWKGEVKGGLFLYGGFGWSGIDGVR
jgi:hypothetical protein